MALSRDNNKTVTRRLAVTGLLLVLVAAGAMAQTHDTPGKDQSGSVSPYLSLRSTADVDAKAENPNPDPEGRFDWATAYNFHTEAMSHDSQAQSSPAHDSRLEALPLEDFTGAYLSVAPRAYAGEFNPAYADHSYNWADLYDFSGRIAYAISRIAIDRERRIPSNLVSDAPVSAENNPLADLPKSSAEGASQGTPDGAVLAAISK